jgi:DNA-binding MarR family transcriptional regulator
MQEPDSFVASFQQWIEVFVRVEMRSLLAYLKANGLSMSQIGALFHIYKRGGGVSDVGEELGVTSAAASQMLERLVQQGLILRSEDPLDRRAKKMVLTEKGQQVLQDSIRGREMWLNSLRDTLTPAEREMIVATMTLLIEKASQLEQ